MPKSRRDPFVAMDATIRSNAKLAALPSDTARLGWLYTGLGSAKLQRPSGCFRSRAHWKEVAGRFARYLTQYIEQGLIEEAPRLCGRCAAAWPELNDGSLVVHDWKRHQTDPWAAPGIESDDASLPVPGFERTRWWRLRAAVMERDQYRCRYCGRDDYDRRDLVVDHVIPVGEGRDDSMENLVTACRSCNGRKGGRRPDEAGMALLPVPIVTESGTDGDAVVTAIENDGDAVVTTSDEDRDAQRDVTYTRARGTPRSEHEHEHERRRESTPHGALSPGARAGLPHVTDAIASAWQDAAGVTLLGSGDYAASYIDDAARRHTETEVINAIETAAAEDFALFTPAAQPLAVAVRNRLDPLPNGKPGRKPPGFARTPDEVEAAFNR